MLSLERIREIETAAGEVFTKRLGLNAPNVPIDVYAIARQEGLSIFAGDFKDASIAGMYDRVNKRIYISAKDPYPRQVFTVAHELGHHILHQDVSVEHFFRRQVDQPSNSNAKLQEQEANWFAASLLMPAEILLDMYVKLQGDENTLATLFAVSKQALKYRLANTRIGQVCI